LGRTKPANGPNNLHSKDFAGAKADALGGADQAAALRARYGLGDGSAG
jgi:hypothetical protein